MPYQERQPSSSKNVLVTAAMRRYCEKYAANDATFRPNEKCEIEDGPDEEESADVDFHADVVFGGIAPLTDEPRRKEQKRERLLGLIAQQHPPEHRSDGPHEDGGRPVLLDIENLTDQGDGRAGGDGADRVQHRGCRLVFFASDGAAEMKDGDHRHHQQIAHAGAKLVPVGGNEEDNAAGQQDAAKNQSNSSLPCDSCNLGPTLGLGFARRCSNRALRRFPGADAGSGFGIENAGRLPAT